MNAGRSGPGLALPPIRGLPPVRRLRGPGPHRPRPLARALRRLAPVWRFDWILTLAVLGLGLVGVLLVWSASQPALQQIGADPRTYLQKQLLNLVIGLILMLAVGLLGRQRLRAYSPSSYAAALLGLIAVLSPLGTSVNGARAWISLPGGFELEPSEYAKLGLVLIMARIFGNQRTADQLLRADLGSRPPGWAPRLRHIALALACAVPVIALVAAEPALGVAVMLVVMIVGLIVLAGTRLRWLAILGGAVVVGALAAWQMHLLKPYQLHRLTAFISPSADPLGAGYSAAQAKIAIGSGGMFGQGLFHGQLIAGNFVPEQNTDFIFTVAGEELGFVGATAIIVLLGIVIVRALLIAARADDQFGMLLAGGIAIWFAVQSFVNIGMTTGIVPVTGQPLPFVSYGGSAMFADMMAVGALQAIHTCRAGERRAYIPGMRQTWRPGGSGRIVRN